MAWIHVGTKYINTDTISKIEMTNGSVRVTYTVNTTLPDGRIIPDVDVFKDEQGAEILKAIQSLQQ